MEVAWLHPVACRPVVSEWLPLSQLVSAPFWLLAVECRSYGYDAAVSAHSCDRLIRLISVIMVIIIIIIIIIIISTTTTTTTTKTNDSQSAKITLL